MRHVGLWVWLLAWSASAAPAHAATLDSLFCDGVGGYEISSLVPAGSWQNLTVRKNGSVLLDNLRNNINVFENDVVTNAPLNIYRGVSVTRGVIRFIILVIRTTSGERFSGIGDAVIFDGRKTTLVKGLNCQTGFR